MNRRASDIYPVCRALLGAEAWDRLATQYGGTLADQALSIALEHAGVKGYPGFLSSLARLEETSAHVRASAALLPKEPDRLLINPTIRIVHVPWKNLASLLDPGQERSSVCPVRGDERVLLWYDPLARHVLARPATDEDLLVLKMIVEEIPSESVASLGSLPVGAVDGAVSRAQSSGLVLAPPSRIRRDPEHFSCKDGIPEQFLWSPSFTLQWHITQTCDLHCRHCYDRSSRSEMKLDQALRILDDYRAFCRSRNVAGAVSFTGGNPLLHPDFTAIYRAAAEHGFSIAILGNPAPAERIAELIAVRMPAFYQVSLEGLREHNDAIRGSGHFDRVLSFLDVLRRLEVYSMVMLTLTSMNIDQVIPLAEALRGKADIFHFNRLSRVGEGADLRLPDPRRYRSFLASYLEAARSNPVMGIKDNLINIIRREEGGPPFGGCTGHGCGAAFNFVSLLADGEVHACRKFPSPIGNIHQQGLARIYDSDEARRYRSGTSACRSCQLHPVCGGCLASAHSHGLDVMTDKDPFCFRTLS